MHACIQYTGGYISMYNAYLTYQEHDLENRDVTAKASETMTEHSKVLFLPVMSPSPHSGPTDS